MYIQQHHHPPQHVVTNTNHHCSNSHITGANEMGNGVSSKGKGGRHNEYSMAMEFSSLIDLLYNFFCIKIV